MKTKADYIAEWHKKTLPTLQQMCKNEGIVYDTTWRKKKLCAKLYELLKSKVDTAKTAKQIEVEEQKAKRIAEDEGLALPNDEQLHPMKKPSSYATLLANLDIYDGVLGKNIRDGKIIVVTGSGQKWEFPIEDS